MDEKNTLNTESSEFTQISKNISEFRERFYKQNNLNEENKEELARLFIYGDNGIKTLSGDYLVNKYVVAKQCENNDEYINKSNESLALFEACLFGLQKDDGKFLNETDEELLKTVLVESELSKEKVSKAVKDAVNKVCKMPPEMPKRAKAGWLPKCLLLIKNNHLSKTDRKKLQLCAKLVSNELNIDTSDELPKMKTILITLFNAVDMNDFSDLNNSSEKTKTIPNISNGVKETKKRNRKSEITNRDVKENRYKVAEHLKEVEKRQEEKEALKKEENNNKTETKEKNIENNIEEKKVKNNKPLLYDLSVFMEKGKKRNKEEVQDEFKYICNQLNNHFRTYKDEDKKMILASVRNSIDFTMGKNITKLMNKEMARKMFEMSKRILEDVSKKIGGKYGTI